MFDKIICDVCFRHCSLSPGQTGFCNARAGSGSKSISLNYGKIASIALDPIEKKPLSRFHQGSYILSVGSFGCNLDCPFCQNDSLSRADENDLHLRYITPKELADMAYSLREKGNIGVAFTYNEPMIGWEYIRDSAIEVHKAGMKNAVVTNGSVEQHILKEVLPYIDAFNIDLKGFTEEWYKKLGGDLNTVLEFIKTSASQSHVELTSLIVPGENDSAHEMRQLSSWIASVDKSIPLHISRFFPRYKMYDKNPTDIGLLYELADIASEKLETVIVGNV